MAIKHKRSEAVAAARAADKAERQAVKALQNDLQAIVEGISGSTTLAEIRGHVKDMAKISRRIIRLPSVAG